MVVSDQEFLGRVELVNVLEHEMEQVHRRPSMVAEKALVATDCVYAMGYGHRVCQDYARSGPGYVIVSDGCSGAKDSDVGARLLVLAAERAIHCFKEPDDAESFVAQAVGMAAASVRAMSLKEDCLDATLMILKVVKDAVWAIIYGDGFLVYRLRGETWCSQVKYGEFPNYPSGTWGPEAAEILIAQDGRSWLLPSINEVADDATKE